MKSALNSDCCEANRVKSPLNSNPNVQNVHDARKSSATVNCIKRDK